MDYVRSEPGGIWEKFGKSPDSRENYSYVILGIQAEFRGEIPKVCFQM